MKPLVTQYSALDITALARGGWLSPNSMYEWVWQPHRGAQVTTVPITVLAEALQVRIPIGTTDALQTLRLTYSRGPRLWFVCPTCARRVGVLYHTVGLPFRCRLCCGLAYPSQYRSRQSSYGRHHRWVKAPM